MFVCFFVSVIYWLLSVVVFIQNMTKKLAALNDAKFFTMFNEAVTHVIVKPGNSKTTSLFI